ncbi:MAG: C39 family peptidase [Cyanobacteria bacterium P01_A01_bin.80]
MTNEMNPSYESFDLNEDGLDETSTQSLDLDVNGDGIPDQTPFDLDVNGDGIPDQTPFDLDNGDGIPDQTQQVDYIDPQLNPLSADNADFVGDLEDREHWHWQGDNEQGEKNTCAVVSQEMILDSFGEEFGLEFTEEQLLDMAKANDWYNDGTPWAYVGSLLEEHGIPVERKDNASLDDIADKLKQGEKVLVGLDADEIWGSESDIIEWQDIISGSIPGQDANHAVQVIGIDYSNPDSIMVVLNDSGHPEGRGRTIPAEQFMDAWDDSGNHIVATAVNGTIPEEFLVASEENNTSVPIA